jgi:hypothetical protein
VELGDPDAVGDPALLLRRDAGLHVDEIDALRGRSDQAVVVAVVVVAQLRFEVLVDVAPRLHPPAVL